MSSLEIETVEKNTNESKRSRVSITFSEKEKEEQECIVLGMATSAMFYFMQASCNCRASYFAQKVFSFFISTFL